MSLSPPEFWTRDPSTYRRAHRVDVYEKATLVLRDLRPGSWLIEGIPCDHVAATDLEAGGGIIAWFGDGDDREVLMSGRVEHIEETEAFTADIFSCAHAAGGSDDLAYVTDYLAHPVPATLNFATAATKLYNGVGETVLKAVVDDNLGPSAHASRRLANFVVAADLLRGSTVRDEVRLDPLGDIIASWCIRAGILPRVRATNGTLEFDVYQGTDRSAELVFAVIRSNVTEVSRTERGPEMNFVWVGGQGEGAARTFVSSSDAASQARWKYRREGFRDRRDTNDATVLAQTATEELDAKAERRAVLVVPLDTDRLRYGVHYNLGDLVTARTRNGEKVVQQIREVTVECTPAEVVRFEPAVTDPLVPPPTTVAIFDEVSALASRAANLEAR